MSADAEKIQGAEAQARPAEALPTPVRRVKKAVLLRPRIAELEWPGILFQALILLGLGIACLAYQFSAPTAIQQQVAKKRLKILDRHFAQIAEFEDAKKIVSKRRSWLRASIRSAQMSTCCWRVLRDLLQRSGDRLNGLDAAKRLEMLEKLQTWLDRIVLRNGQLDIHDYKEFRRTF